MNNRHTARALWRFVLAPTVLLAFAPFAAVGDLTGDDVVRRVQARYDATSAFTAKVTQVMKIASLDKTFESTGDVAFKKPGKMRWEFLEDEPQIIVADGETLWFYRPDERQVFKAPFDAAFRSSTPISFLTGVGQIANDFQATVDGVSEDGKLLYLLLVPKTATSEVGRLRLLVEPQTADIRGAEVYDPLGNVSHLRFDDVRRNVEIGDERFAFEVPEGVDVIKAR